MNKQIVPVNSNNSITQYREELDISIATAKAYPRNIYGVEENIKANIQSSVDVAKTMWYSKPRKGKGNVTVMIEGASIRLAELFMTYWGNMRVSSEITSIDDRYVTARALVFDLENNVAVCKEVKRSIVTSDGVRYSDEMIQNTAQACVSIAIRNALFTLIPKGLINKMMNFAKEMCVSHPQERKKPLKERFDDAVNKFKEFGIKREDILNHLNIKDEKSFTEEHLKYLWGLYNSLSTGETNADTIKSVTLDGELLYGTENNKE